MQRLLAALLLLSSVCLAQSAPDSLSKLASDFWAWRAHYRPYSTDDVPRMEQVRGKRDWSAAAIAKQKSDLAAFQRRWKALSTEGWPVSEKVDHRLMGSALARVRWELEVNPSWERDPSFYVDQAVVALQQELMDPEPFDATRAEEIVTRVDNIPTILEQGKQNLKPVALFATIAIDSLGDIDYRLERVKEGVAPLLTSDALRARFDSAMPKAIRALKEYREWLRQSLPSMRQNHFLGEKAYSFYLHEVALLPYTPEQMLAMARQDLDRVATFESLEAQRDRNAPQLKMAANADEQIARMQKADAETRRYLGEHYILTIPTDLPHWTQRLAPDYVTAFNGFAELDDFTGPSRPKQDGTRWIQQPSEDSPFFFRAYAKDPRTTGVHEGIPGHFTQLSLSRRNPDPIRRYCYDSVANEGLGFYAEEMMLQAGLYDDSPRTRQIIYSFARLRALRVEADVKLATGTFSLAQAGDYLARSVPMDTASAKGDAAMYASAPGLGITYEIGKLQIEALLADRRTQLGDKFDLQQFHDYLWSNGNVPLSLLRWELLGDDADLKKADQLASTD
jgi:uncharacterized protein (DUF885 family)